MILSVGQPIGRHASSCGYCSPSGERSKTDSSHTAASLVALQLSSEVYQMMLNRGWRRSGECLAVYANVHIDTYRNKQEDFAISRTYDPPAVPLYVSYAAQKRFMYSLNRGKQKGKDNAKFNLRASIHASEFHSDQNQHFAHKFEMTLEPSSYTDEKYELFKKYQTEIHYDSTSPEGFRNFLVATPLHQQEPIQYSSPPTSDLPTHYGSYHWCYRLDGKLIAISVIDILPECVSSVYFMYDKDYEAYSLGKLSALKENVLAQELHAAGAPSLRYLYLGYYVHSCQKMRHGEYQPSFLCDPETFEWYPFADCTALLAEYRYACFARPERSLRGEPDPELGTVVFLIPYNNSDPRMFI
ncbi:arginine-tRNA-protein transferase [Lentinula edodes]|nr:arginine-tRNA-protein transferase [Lentinula edodes]